MNHCFFPEIRPFAKVNRWYKRNSCWIKLLLIVLLGISLTFNAYQHKIINYYKEINHGLSLEKGS